MKARAVLCAITLGGFALVSCGEVESDLITRKSVTAESCTSDADCPSNDPRCDARGFCSQCLDKSDCAAGQACALPSGTCVAGCGPETPCSTEKPVCDTATSLCAGCTGDSDCPGTHCDTATGRCVECFQSTAGTDCAGELPLCDASGRCVECTVTAHCSVGEECSTVLGVCATACPAAGGCPADEPRCDETIGFCVECVYDVDCGAGEVCRRWECVESSTGL
jgi:hypothetical protein